MNKSDSEELQESNQEDDGSDGWTDFLIMDFPRLSIQDPRVQKFEEEGSQRVGAAAVWGKESGIRTFVGQL